MSVSRDTLLEVPPRPGLVDYAPILLQQPEAIIWTPKNRPVPENGLGGQVVDQAVRRILGQIFRSDPTQMVVEGLSRAFIEAYNDASRPVQFAIIGGVSAGAIYYAIDNFDDLIAQLGNQRFTVDLPVHLIGIEGVKLSVQIALNNFNPRLSMVMLEITSFLGGKLSANYSLDSNRANIRWEVQKLFVDGLSLTVNVNGIGGAGTQWDATLRYQVTF